MNYTYLDSPTGPLLLAGDEEGLSLIHFFDGTIPRKPDPGALVAVCRELGVAPASCAMVGDSEVDIATARAAGVLAVGVTWGLRDVAVLREAQPDVLVSSPDELAHVLRSR